MHFFDSHAHLGEIAQIEQVIERAKEAGISKILNICTDPETLKKGLALEKRFSEIKNAGATTPHDVEKEGQEAFAIFEKAAKEKKIVAVGETGLDYYYKELNPQIQKKFLIRYLHLAIECNLPVIFHCREAFRDLFETADSEYKRGAPAILHCFTGTMDEAKGVLDRGWYLSFSGIITFKKSELLREIAKMAPLNQILIETDTPFLAPQGQRGKPNEPSFIVETAQCIADMRRISLEEVASATYQNGIALFSNS